MKKNFFGLIASILFVNLSFGQNDSNQARLFPLGIKFNVSADLVSIDGNGCFTVNVRVYMIDNAGNSLLVASGNSQVCEGRSASDGNKDSELCENGLYKGDYISHPNQKGLKYCLIDCLKEEAVYDEYQTEKHRVLSSIKK
jgi:hypothetical protein